ncbi:MAG TPA: hypothetical protein VH280_06315 [Verrucomicrobiae bacterium]|nr:hypothetical protein [Verrucomicrobiae bacterium]
MMVSPDPYVQEYPFTEYDDSGFQAVQNWSAQAIATNGLSTASIYIGSSYTSPLDNYQSSWTVPPYFDGHDQLKQNLIFLLRQPGLVPFEYELKDDSGEPFGYKAEQEPSDYAYAGIFDARSVWTGYAMSLGDNELDACRPFYENYLYANFVYQTNDVNQNGYLASRVSEIFNPFFPDTDEALLLTNLPPFLFPQPTTQGTDIPNQINNTQWLYGLPFQRVNYFVTNGVGYGLAGNGLTFVTSPTNVYLNDFTMENNPVNYFGIPIQSDQVVYAEWSLGAPLQFQVEMPGDSFTGSLGFAFPETIQPAFKTVEYDFRNPATASLPGNSSFTPTNNDDLLIASVADPTFQVAGYVKLAVTNTIYPAVYGYLGQYFTNAYQISSNGEVTANTTGVLSSYGQFFATQPGQAALVTMPDPDTGQQGTDVVDVISLNVDANHDGTMDFSFGGSDFVTANNPYRFWINDDQDTGDDGGNGVSLTGSPLADGVRFIGLDDDYQPVYKIHGTRDLVDFFPVYVNIGSLFRSNVLSAGIDYADTNWQFVLSQADGALRFAYTDLAPTNYMNYLRDTNEATALADFLTTTSPTLTTVTGNGVALSGDFVGNIATNNGGIVLVEAWTNTTQPLVLTVYHGTNQIAQTSLYLSISEVEQMFRHKNCLLTPQANEVPDRLTAADVPNEPPTNDKNFIFVHGYNVNVTQARGWDADYFKRLYWSGSHAKFYGVTWESADSQKANAVTISLQTNIVNAFNTAPLFNSFLDSLSGTNVVASHSLGNILVLSTLNDCTNESINTYFMVDAALAIEAIDGSASPNPDMYPSAWVGYNDYLLASGWHTLWPATDARSTLTWNGRLAGLQDANVYNFYSSGEEVLRDFPGDPPSSLPNIAADEVVYAGEGETGQYTWSWQEKNKGLMGGNWILSSDHGGWQFNKAYETNFVSDGVTYWVQMPPGAAAELTTNQLQTNAFFNFASGGLYSFNNDLALETSSGSSYAQANRDRILSDAIPCLTLPVGANTTTILDQPGVTHNFDMQLSYENGWPADRGKAAYPLGTTAAGEWHHSDNRAVAYTFTYKLFNQMVNLGNLQ